jgi:hypothetical protein
MMKLSDKGEKIKDLVQRIENELAARTQPSSSVNEVAASLASVQLSEALEWNAVENTSTHASEKDLNPDDSLFSFIQANKTSKTRYIHNLHL